MIKFKRVIHKWNKTHALAYEISPDEVEKVRLMYKKPDAEAGDYLVKIPVNNRHFIKKPEQFYKMYRNPH